MHDSLQAVNPRQNRIFNNKADGFFHHFVGVAESIRNFFQIFGLVKFFCQRIVNAGQFGHGVPREMLPDSISTEQIKQAMKKCILSKKDNLFELLGIIINDNYLY